MDMTTALSDLELRLSLRAILMFETLRDKSFAQLELEDEEDMLALLYSMYDARCPSEATLSDLRRLYATDQSVLERHMLQTRRLLERDRQFAEALQPRGKAPTDQEREQVAPLRMTAVASRLMVEAGLSPQYVMDRMEQWEIPHLLQALEERKKEQMERDRLWTYYQILPHIDGKRFKHPRDIFPFPWEIDQMLRDDQKAREELEAELDFLAQADLSDLSEDLGSSTPSSTSSTSTTSSPTSSTL